jgi:type II secretory pathway pseudopilin PulG
LRNKGFSILDILIAVLIVAVLAALIIPKKNKDREEAIKTESREKMKEIAKAQDLYFKTAGGKIDPDKVDALLDSLKVEREKAEAQRKKSAQPVEIMSFERVYTNDVELLKPLLPQNFNPASPPNGKDYIIVVRDSTYYCIYDPNGNGAVLNGKALWEEN